MPLKSKYDIDLKLLTMKIKEITEKKSKPKQVRTKKARWKRPNLDPFEDEKNPLVNPFVTPKFVIPVVRVTINQGCFRIVDGVEKSIEEEIDREKHKFIKIYTDLNYDEEDEEGNAITLKKFKAPGLRTDRAKLSYRASHLLWWIMDELKMAKDYVVINKERYRAESNVGSINTVKAAMDELQAFGFITKSIIKDSYWINPLYMFKGDRAKKYPDNIEVVEERKYKGNLKEEDLI